MTRRLLPLALPLLAPVLLAQADGDPAAAWSEVVAEWHERAGRQKIVGSSLAFFHRDRTFGPAVHGHADLASGRKVDADTIYHWASITKTFTAIAIMQLRDRGRLKLDDPIVDYLPELRGVHNPHGPMRAITLRHLLTHSSGFRGPTWPWKSKPWHPHEPTRWDQVVAMIPYTEIAFAPGTKVSYSNPAFIFLGRVIEQLSGDDYEVYVDKNILKPLGMHRSYFDRTPYHLLRHRSNNYRLVAGKPVADGLDFDTGITVANGGLNAPLPDMLRYLRFLAGCSGDDTARAVLTRASLEEMWVPHKLEDGTPTTMGLAFFLDDAGGVAVVGHTGGQKSFNTFVYVDPAAQTGCIAAFNTSEQVPRSVFGETRRRIFASMFPRFARAPRSAQQLNMRGVQLRREGKLEEAVLLHRRALELDPEDADTLDALGTVEGLAGRKAESIGYLTRALRLDPDRPMAHNNLGVALRSMGRLAEAAAHFRHAVRLAPRDALGHRNLGETLRTLGQGEEAARHLERAAALERAAKRR